MQQLMGQQVTLDKLPYLLRLLTDQVNFWYAYWDLDAYDDFDSYEFLSLFVCLLFTTQNEGPAAAEGPSGDIFWIVISHETFA